MSAIDYPPQRATPKPAEFLFSESLYTWVATLDQKRFGLMYVVAVLLLMVATGVMALVIRWRLAFPKEHVVGPDTYNRLFTMHEAR